MADWVLSGIDQTGACWENVPDTVLFQIMSYLPVRSLLNCSVACNRWNRLAFSDVLWRELLQRTWQIDRAVPMAPGAVSWQEEYKRLYFHSPVVESEVIQSHTDEVLHVSFSHNGEMFATCSKDNSIKVITAYKLYYCYM